MCPTTWRPDFELSGVTSPRVRLPGAHNPLSHVNPYFPAPRPLPFLFIFPLFLFLALFFLALFPFPSPMFTDSGSGER